MNVELFAAAKVMWSPIFVSSTSVASRLKVVVLIEHTPNAAGNAFGEVSPLLRALHVGGMFHTAVTHALANRESDAAPHAHDDHSALPSGDQACARSLWRKAQLALRL